MYSPVIFSRMSEDKDVTLKTSKYKYVIPKGTELLMGPILTQRYYCNNSTNTEEGEIIGAEGKQHGIKKQKFDTFNPDRVVDKNEPFFPFALGARNCVGREMGMAELRAVLTQILYNYNLVLRPQDKERGALLGINLTLFMPYYGIKITKRRDEEVTLEQK